jgi:hypothetical protein
MESSGREASAGMSSQAIFPARNASIALQAGNLYQGKSILPQLLLENQQLSFA